MRKIADGTGIECCSSVNTGTSARSPPPHPECLTIPIPANDPAFNPTGREGITCMNLVRSVFGKNLDGTTPPLRTQVRVFYFGFCFNYSNHCNLITG